MQGEYDSSAEFNSVGDIGYKPKIISRRQMLGLDDLEADVIKLPEFSRRTLLAGLASSLGLVGIGGAKVVFEMIASGPQEILAHETGDICADNYNAVCIAQSSGLEVPSSTTSGIIETTTSTTLPIVTPPPTTNTAPPQVTNQLVEVAALPVELPPPPPEAPHREMSISEYMANKELFISKLPTMETIHSMYPDWVLFNQVPEQLEHIEMLNQQVQLDPNEYSQFIINQNYNTAFGTHREAIAPYMLIWHWAVGEYIDPQDLANKMSPNSSVQMYAHKDDVIYQMVPELNSLTGHSNVPINPWALGIEVYTGEYGKEKSCLFGYTPSRVKNGIYAVVHALNHAGLPINETTLLGHFAADLIFRNPYYDPYTGAFHALDGYAPIRIRKADPPQEFIRMIVSKAVSLAQQIGYPVA